MASMLQSKKLIAEKLFVLAASRHGSPIAPPVSGLVPGPETWTQKALSTPPPLLRPPRSMSILLRPSHECSTSHGPGHRSLFTGGVHALVWPLGRRAVENRFSYCGLLVEQC
jgi:hypothetical protein